MQRDRGADNAGAEHDRIGACHDVLCAACAIRPRAYIEGVPPLHLWPAICPCRHRVRRTRGLQEGIDAPPAPHRAIDPGRRFRQARRGGARDRRGRRRLDPCRRHGRPFRAQYHHRSRRGEGAAAAHQEAVRRASDDRALRSLSRGLRQGRRRPHHRACGGRPARPPLAAGDPRARQEGRRDPQSRHAGEHHRAGHRSGRSDPGHVGQSRLRRPDIHPGAVEKIARLRALAGGRPIDIEVDGGITPETAPQVARPAPMCWSRARPCSRAARRRPTRPISRRSATRRRWRAAKPHDPALHPARHGRDLGPADALSHLVRDRGACRRRHGRARHHPEGGGARRSGRRAATPRSTSRASTRSSARSSTTSSPSSPISPRSSGRRRASCTRA